jgi:quercetin dioxygenase-like cupin family protein
LTLVHGTSSTSTLETKYWWSPKAGTVANDNESLSVTEGDVVVIPAGENHWHGAPDSTSMAHITITVKGSETEQTEP